MQVLHPFEKAGLGKAPFKCVAVTTNLWTSGCGQVTKPGGSCDYCGTGIMFEYHIVGADGSKFKVGSDCVAKTGGQQYVEGFKRVKAAHLAEKRSAKRKAKWEARQAQWAAEAAEKRVAFEAANPGLFEAMQARAASSGFFKDLVRNVERFGGLTPNQLTAVNRIMSEDVAKARLEAQSVFKGTVGKPYSGKWQVLKVMSWTSNFYPHPVTYLHILSDGQNVFTYKGSRFLGNKGDFAEGTFTVKEHSVYEGVNQTVLARPRKDLVTRLAGEEAAA